MHVQRVVKATRTVRVPISEEAESGDKHPVPGLDPVSIVIKSPSEDAGFVGDVLLESQDPVRGRSMVRKSSRCRNTVPSKAREVGVGIPCVKPPNAPRKYKCEFCTQSFEGKAALHHHLKTDHPDTPRHACTFCDKLFLTKAARDFHQTSEHERKHVCAKCHASFGYPSELKRHKLTHGAKAFKYHLCDKTYMWKSDLKKHLSTHSEDHPVLKCPHCAGFETFSKKLLNQHMS